MTRRIGALRGLAALTSLSIALASGCGGGGGGGTPGIEEFVSGMRVSGQPDVVAKLMQGDPPEESAGPEIVAPTGPAPVNAGTTIGPVQITSTEEFSTLLLEIPGSSGYWVLEFGELGGGAGAGTQEGGTTLSIDVTFGNDPPDANFDCLFSGSQNGAVGSAAVTEIVVEECTVRDFCNEACSPPEASPCLEYCSVASVLPSCVLDATAPVVCGAVFSCMDSPTCDAVGHCAEDDTSGAISASCAESACEALDSLQ